MGVALKESQKEADVRHLLDRMKAEIVKSLPKHIPAEYFLRVALTATKKTPKLLDCTQQSLAAALVVSAQLGLVPDGTLGLAYLVPYGNTVTLIPGYRGLMELCRRSGEVGAFHSFCVHEADEFEYELGIEPTIRHKPARVENPGPMTDVYAVAKLRGGDTQFVVMSRREVDAIRARSKSSNNGPWVTDYEAMAKKTAIRQLCKYLPVSTDRLAKAIEQSDAADRGESIDVEYGVPTTEPRPRVQMEPFDLPDTPAIENPAESWVGETAKWTATHQSAREWADTKYPGVNQLKSALRAKYAVDAIEQLTEEQAAAFAASMQG